MFKESYKKTLICYFTKKKMKIHPMTFKIRNHKMTFKISNGEVITLSLNNPDSSSTFCAAALFENKNGDYFLTKEERYFRGHQLADAHYKFGFNWTAGSK